MSNQNVSKNLMIISSIIGIVLLYFAYNYLVKLEDCLCVQGIANENQKSNITHLKYIELFLLVIALLNLFIAFKKKLSPIASTIFFFIIILLYLIFVYNVMKLYNNIPSNCECALQWPRYFIYLQSLLYSLTLLLIFVGIFTFVYSFSKTRKGLRK